MTYFEKFIRFFNAYEPSDREGFKELEFKLLLDPKGKIPNFIKQHVRGSPAMSRAILSDLLRLYTPQVFQVIGFISNGSGYESFIKELYFNDGVQVKENKRVYKKTSAHSPIYLCGNDTCCMKLSFSIETPWVEQTDFDIIRYKYRYSFFVDEWRVDFTFVKQSTTKEISAIKETKDKLFASGVRTDNILEPESNWIWTYADSIEIEFEFRPDMGIELSLDSIKKIYALIDGVLSSENYSKDILSKVYAVVNGVTADGSGTTRHSLKQILPNAIEINKKQYFTEILPEIDRYYITDKADGIRTILILNSGRAAYYDTEYHLAHDILTADFKLKETILECEKIHETFHVFDILQYDGINVAIEPFTKRLAYMQKVGDVVGAENKNLRIKQFLRLTNENYTTAIASFYEDAHKNGYTVDGLIFTSCNEAYRRTKFYKWKPMHDMTIDFIAKRCPKELEGISPYTTRENCYIYILFSGISSKEFRKLNLKKIQYYSKLFSYTNKQYFPIQFSPSDCPNAYIWYHPSADLDNKVVELNYDVHLKEWRLNRVREDRKDDLESRHYYGNNFRVAESIWRNYSNPLMMEFLAADYKDAERDFYFITSQSVAHECIRKFNNTVKYELIKKYAIEGSWLVDLGCGKGQDLFKYIKSRIGNVLLIDANENNLCEVIARKYSFCGNKAFDRSAMSIYVQALDLNAYYIDNLNQLNAAGIPIVKHETKLIVCNFAIHYLIRTTRQITNVVNMVNSLLASGGRFMITFMDGKKIFDLLSLSNEWGDGTKYKIKKIYRGAKFTGINQMIDVLLPFSDGKLYQESLVNLELLEKYFAKKKIMLESHDTFETYLPLFQRTQPLYNRLDAMDIEYIKLLSFAIFYKP